MQLLETNDLILKIILILSADVKKTTFIVCVRIQGRGRYFNDFDTISRRKVSSAFFFIQKVRRRTV